jgi:trimeric autotransporter adhesin
MKSPRSSATNLDRSKQRQHKLSRALFATTFIASSHLLTVMSANANPIPTPAQPSPVVPTRTILNGSFEQPVLNNGAGYVVPESYNYAIPVIWRTTEKVTPYTDSLEVWRGVNTGAGGQTVLSGAGSQHAELNGSSNASLYQDVCVLPGETVGWSLLHAARKNGTSNLNPTNIMQVSITNPSSWSNSKTPPSTKLYNSGNLSTSYDDGWKSKTGTWTSTITSIQPLRFAFEAIQGSNGNITYGNFIDDVKLDLAPIIDFLPTDGGNVNLDSTIEGNPATGNPPYYYLSLRINGIMKTAGSVKVNLTGLNAGRQYTIGSVLKGTAAATGLSATKVDNQITLTIPAGTYDANVASNYIHIPINFSDTIKQTDDNLSFLLFAPTGGGVSGVSANLTVGSTNCSSAARDTVNVLLRDDDYIERVQLPISVAAYRSK